MRRISKLQIRKQPLFIFSGILFGLVLLFFSFQMVSANIVPQYLKSGRTYDQELDYFQWNGSVGVVRLYHRDNTSLPASEGGSSCTNGCTENVTRISNGGSISGNFTYLKTLSFQLAYSGDSSVGKAVIRACGQTVRIVDLYQSGAGAPGFNNLPSPAWDVPTTEDCTWSITASGGYVDFRALTTTFPSTSAPSVDLKVNGVDGPITLLSPGRYALSWTSTNAAACTASGDWNGAQATNGTQSYSNVVGGSYTYTLSCTNPSGSAWDSLTISVEEMPSVRITAPDMLTAPATFTASWSSMNAVACTGADRFMGLSGIDGLKQELDLGPGEYDYTVTCSNATGQTVTETSRTIVYDAPMVAVNVNGLAGPRIRFSAPGFFTVSWISNHATVCSGAERFSGYTGTSGSRTESAVPAGTVWEYTMSCQNAAGATATDTVTVEIVDSLTGSITVAHAQLLLFGPNLGQPAQTLRGEVSGGVPPYSIVVRVRAPSGALVSLNQSETAWTVTPENSGDLNFGTTEEGSWTAWAELTDSSSQTYQTPSATWEVVWYPVHGRP